MRFSQNVRMRMLLGVAAVLVPMAAHVGAAEAGDRGFYVSGAGGLNLVPDSDITGTGINTEASFDNGWALLGALGYAYGNGFRTEIEGGYRNNDVDALTGAANGTGDVKSTSVMFNALYGFENESRLTPYVGVGAGMLWANFDGVRPVGAGALDDSDTVFAMQGILGADYLVTEALSLFAQYNYLTGFGSEMQVQTGTAVDVDVDNNTVVFGLRYRFGGPAPAPAPVAAAPVVQRAAPVAQKAELPTYLVFFDFDKSEVTPEAREILQKAARDARNGSVARIEVTGHADRSGTDSYNMKLSQRRADAVRAELSRLGIPMQDIATFAKGEREPLVPTADGVREPQNRRVEIYYNVR